MRVIRSEQFKADLIEHYHTIARDQPAAAERFLDEVEQLLDALSEFPMHGRAWESPKSALSAFRLRKVPRYDVLIFYRVEKDGVFVHRAVHGSRDRIWEFLDFDQTTE